MTSDEPIGKSGYFIFDWRLSPKLFKGEPDHIHDVLKRFGPRRRSNLRKIVQELDEMALDYRIADTKKKMPPPKFEKADAKLERFEKLLQKGQAQWKELAPLLPTFATQRLKMIPRGWRGQYEAHVAMTSIDFDPLATALLQIIRKLRNSKTYAAAHHQTGGKSAERAYLWEPLLRLMKKYHVKPGQHGSFLGAVKSLHLAVGIDAPSEGAVKKMLHDLRQRERS
jgi:hypothetical protein